MENSWQIFQEMERSLRWNSRGRASPAHVASWEGGQSAASQKSATCSGCWFCGFLVFASHTFKSGLNWQNNLKTFTSHELWICEMLFLVYKLTKLKFVLFLIPVLCSRRTLCRVVRSAVSFPTHSRCPCQQLKHLFVLASAIHAPSLGTRSSSISLIYKML